MPDVNAANANVSRIEFEAAMMQQEHRLFRILSNYWNRSTYEKGDPRRDAVTSAFLWRVAIALMPAAAASGAGIIALLSLAVAWRSTSLIREQNQLIAAIANDQQTASSAQEVVRLTSTWYTQLQELDVENRRTPERDKAEFDAVAYEYVNNRLVLPELMYHVNILKPNDEASDLVYHVEEFLTLVTDYDRLQPGDRTNTCLALMRALERHARLDSTLQQIAKAAAPLSAKSR